MRRTGRTALSAAILVAVGACGSPNASPNGTATATGQAGNLPALNLAHVQTETVAARGATIKRGGGTVTATGSNGVVYTLTVPPGALGADTNIGLYPVIAMDTLVKNGALVGGVQFTPDGTTLDFPATLSLEVPPDIDLTHVVGYSYSGDAGDPELRPALVSGRTITIKVRHFSGIGASRTYGDLLGVMGGLAAWQQAIYQEIENPARSMATIADLLRIQYDDVVKPALGLCTNVEPAPFAAGASCDLDGTKAAEAQWAYEDWRNALLYVQIQFTGFTVNPELGQSKVLAATHLQDWYGALNDRCRSLSGNSIVGDSPENPVRWAGLAFAHALDWATEWDIASGANGLDLESLLEHLCAKVVIDPGRSYSAASPGDTGTLTLNAGVTVESAVDVAGPVRHDLPIQVKVTGAQADAVGVTDSQGDYHVDLQWPENVDPIKVDILASINVDNPNVQRIARFDRITKSAKPGRLTYRSDVTSDHNPQLFTSNDDGSNLFQLTHDTPGRFSDSPAFSPDGTQIAFSSARGGTGVLHIWLMNADGSNARPLTNGPDADGYPAWSPDGKRIAFDRHQGLYVMDANGANQVQLTNPSVGVDGFPDWSPDGVWIAFESNRNGTMQVYLLDPLDPNNPAQAQPLIKDGGTKQSFAPAWSPDGKLIAFVGFTGTFGLYTVHADGTGAKLIHDGLPGITYPVWSPDGTRIAFTMPVPATGGGEATEVAAIFVIGLDGRGLKQVTSADGSTTEPDWAFAAP